MKLSLQLWVNGNVCHLVPRHTMLTLCGRVVRPSLVGRERKVACTACKKRATV